MSEISVREVKKITGDRDYWKLFENEHWMLLSFTQRDTARFGWNWNGTFTRYVTITTATMDFLDNIDADLWDQAFREAS